MPDSANAEHRTMQTLEDDGTGGTDEASVTLLRRLEDLERFARRVEDLERFARRVEDLENLRAEGPLRLPPPTTTQPSLHAEQTHIYTLEFPVEQIRHLAVGTAKPSVVTAETTGFLVGVKFKLMFALGMLYIDVLNINDLLRGSFCKGIEVTVLHPEINYRKKMSYTLSNQNSFKLQQLALLDSQIYLMRLPDNKLDVRVLIKDINQDNENK